jgi:hypothetical protein
MAGLILNQPDEGEATMDHATHAHGKSEQSDNRWKWALAGFLAVAVFFLWTEHRAHLLGALPYLLILACPLMHLFHHGGHGHATHQQGTAGSSDGKHRQVPAPGEQP